MNKPYYNDQAYIAQEFRLLDEYITETARLAHFKINSYKLSLVGAAFCQSRAELTAVIKGTLLNYIDPVAVLSDLGFFMAEIDN